MLIILTLTLNTSNVGGTTIEDNAPITPIVFQLNGIAGNDAAVLFRPCLMVFAPMAHASLLRFQAAVLYYIMIALNVVVNILTIYHCWLGAHRCRVSRPSGRLRFRAQCIRHAV